LPADSAAWASVFAHVTISDDAQEQLRVARSCARYHARQVEPLPSLAPRALGEVLRVGFVSADFHQHATAILMVEVFEHLHADPRFEVTMYSHGPEDASPMRERLKRACTKFIKVDAFSDLQVAQMVRDDSIDVLVDLKGHTRSGRLGIFAH